MAIGYLVIYIPYEMGRHDMKKIIMWFIKIIAKKLLNLNCYYEWVYNHFTWISVLSSSDILNKFLSYTFNIVKYECVWSHLHSSALFLHFLLNLSLQHTSGLEHFVSWVRTVTTCRIFTVYVMHLILSIVSILLHLTLMYPVSWSFISL
jgi:hypothetical protein